MLDPKQLRNNPDAVKKALKDRNADASLVDKFLAADERWRKATFEVDELKNRRNEITDKIAQMKKKKEDTSAIIAEMKKAADRIKELDEIRRVEEEQAKKVLLEFPNLPHVSVPPGMDARDNIEVRKWGEAKKAKVKPHYEIGKELGILDFESAAKIAGSRFCTLKGLGAQLERALINFMLDLHSEEHGYTEVFPPILVNADSMQGTGQLPKFEEDLFKCRDDEFYLVPTAEVSVTNIHKNEILSLDQLPIKYCAFSPCFRREAGSYGKDVRGLIRQHQFNKVELVKFVDPQKSYEELESLTKNAEEVLRRLGLPYRVVELCGGDLGFAAAKTFDLEVWFPSEGKYREISSCSNFETFQARRTNIKFRKDPKAKPEFVHTLNGSGLAVGRTMAAILENFQKDDGSVEVPEALHQYLEVPILKIGK
ncbi:MAG: serine--tRNA ligase [Candidatus Margulisbacteria bacterium]|nr:serine--tRNA ligase [Candidatus Margulisiibacteriota bacterium]MBU1022174.1 serine--tRNA ligase [Candidatus Margulisiibacteriota bacterium]MBU1729387.1 serine--tRNA ligase [Candidatus Margulisiibacteriota bacterium]MBU1955660.1 serine--tRNA ligase [Candidatus Margulisiibacteriota bacterium]